MSASASARGAAWKRPEVVGGFLERRRRVLPLVELQEDLVAWLPRRQGHPVEDAQIHFKWGEVAVFAGARPADR